MAFLRVEHHTQEAIEQYKWHREIRLHPGEINLRRAREGQAPYMSVRRSVVLVERIHIPFGTTKQEVPSDVAKDNPINLAYYHYHTI